MKEILYAHTWSWTILEIQKRISVVILILVLIFPCKEPKSFRAFPF